MSNMPISLMEDSPPLLDFSEGTKRNGPESEKAGHPVFDDIHIVTITPMGDNKTKVVKYAPEWLNHLKERLHNKQISDQYYKFCVDSYEAWKDKREAPTTGTPIREWPQITKAQAEMVLNANIRSIEDLANAPEEALQTIGMGARALKQKAQAYLEAAKDAGKLSERMNKLQTDLETAEEQRKADQDKIAELEAKLASQPVVTNSTGEEEAA